jgi:hypothetical protein
MMRRDVASVDGAGMVVRRLRARQGEIEDAIFAQVRELVPAPADDTQYLEGLRAAVAGAVEFCLVGLERGDGFSAEIPAPAVAQAQRAARNGVSLDAVLRRYIVGNALICDYIMQECDSLELRGRVSGRELLRAQSAQLDRLVIGVTREHVAELQRAGRSQEHRLLEHVRILLASEHSDAGMVPGGVDPELDYDLGGEHLGVIAIGTESEAAMRRVAERLERRLLCVAGERGIVWAWLGGRRVLPVDEIERACAAHEKGDVRFVLGEPAGGLEGWRMTHRQAQAALLVAQRTSQRVTRYGDVVLLAATLGDELLARSLVGIYLTPLGAAHGGGEVLLQSLRAYLAAGRSVSSAAAALGVARKTVEGRLRTAEEKLGRTLHPCPAELEVALLLAELGPVSSPPDISITG